MSEMLIKVTQVVDKDYLNGSYTFPNESNSKAISDNQKIVQSKKASIL